MTRVMYDSVNPYNIPLISGTLVAGYVNGSIYTWPQAGWNRFAAAHITTVTTDVIGNRPDADALDIENGDATVAEAVTWVRDKLAMKPSYLPLLYCNRSTLTPLFNALNGAGFEVAKHFRLWIGTLDGTKTVTDMTGVTAVQWAGSKLTGANYDESIVYDDTFKAASPTPVPVSQYPTDQDGLIVSFTTKLWRSAKSTDGGKTWS